MDQFADLHIHTYYSDGTLSPLEVVEQAHKNGLSCIAVTDHDTIDAIEPTREVAQQFGIEVLSGIEVSSSYNGKDIHILGYLFDHRSLKFTEQLKEMQLLRVDRIKLMIEKLHGLGLKKISFDEVKDIARAGSIGRPHLAACLMNSGYVGSIQEAFDRYLAEGGPGYVSKFKISPYEAIGLIRDAGGVAVFAHPMLTNRDELIPSLVREGLKGIEVFYPNCSETVMNFYLKLAKKNNIAATGGSDAHGSHKKYTYIGKVKLPYERVEELKRMKNG